MLRIAGSSPQEMGGRMSPMDVRFNVGHGIEDYRMKKWRSLKAIVAS